MALRWFSSRNRSNFDKNRSKSLIFASIPSFLTPQALESRVDELVAMSSRLESEISRGAEELSGNEKALQTADALRSKQLEAYEADAQELAQSAMSVEKALEVISKSSFLQMSKKSVARAMAQVKVVMKKHVRWLTSEQQQELELLEDPKKLRRGL